MDLYAQYRLERSFPCEDCGAKPDEKCRGKRKPYLESTHASRQRQAGNKYVR